jgi:adenylate cyclase
VTAVIVERELDFEVPRQVVWRVVSDTNRLNEALGYPPLAVTPHAGRDAARFLVKTRLAGLPVEYQEYPFEWVENERQVVKRVMRGGPLRGLTMRWELSDAAGGRGRTHVRMEVAVEPRLPLLAPLLRAQTARTADKLVEAMRQGVAAVATGGRPTGIHFPAVISALARAAGALLAQVPSAHTGLARRLVEHLSDTPDADLVRIRPFELADSWRADRRAVASVCLAGVVAGLLQLRWDLICPSCRTATERLSTLSELSDHAACPLCDLRFQVDFDRTVEATFQPAPAVRKIAAGPFCIGGAARMPHVVAQVILPAGGEAVVRAPEAPGRYRLFLRGGATAALEVDAAAEAAEAAVTAGEALSPARLVLAPGAPIRIHHPGPDERHLKLERLEHAERAATAHFIGTLPAFRRLFSAEALRPGVALEVARTTILFSDLAGSTALYTRLGDAKAFATVLEHFDVLGLAIERHAGAIVKTIGDSVMAVFMDERDALHAAIRMQREYSAFRSRVPEAAPTALRVGLYAGPCYAVNANRTVDYFGQSVNTAARLHGQAHDGEIVITSDLADRAEASAWLPGAQITERFDAILKGIGSPLRLARISLAPHADSQPQGRARAQ